MWNNWKYRALALLMALLCWYVVSGQEKVETWLEVPLEFVNLPPRMEITSSLVSKIQVRIRGTSNQVRSLNIGRLAYKLDLGKIQAGLNILPLTTERMTVTSAVEIVEIRPASLELMADTAISKEVPVHLDWLGLPAPDTQVQDVHLTPSRINITGLASELESVDEVQTDKVSIVDNEKLNVSGRVALLIPNGLRSEISSVQYTIDFAFKTQELWVKLNVDSIKYDFSYTIEPKFARAKLAIPERLLKDKDWRESLALVVDPGENPALGESMLRPELRLPEGVKVLELKPEEIKIVVPHKDEPVPQPDF